MSAELTTTYTPLIQTLVFVYEKAMRLSPAARHRYTTGSILTMASCDAERIYQGVLTSQWAWAGPLVIMVAMALTVNELGLAPGLVGVGIMVLAMLYQGQSASKAGTQREALVKRTDERLKLTYAFFFFFFLFTTPQPALSINY